MLVDAFLNTLISFLGYYIVRVYSGSFSEERAVSIFRLQESLFHPEDLKR